MIRKFLLITLVMVFIILNIECCGAAESFTLPHKISLTECKEEYFNWHNGTNVSDCLTCEVCCDNNYPCIEWNQSWSGTELGEPTLVGILNKELKLKEDSGSSEVWIDCYNTVAGEDVSYLAVGIRFKPDEDYNVESGAMILYFSDGNSITCSGMGLCEFYLTEDNVVSYRNGEKYSEVTITHGSEITRIRFVTSRTGTSLGLYDVFTQTPFAIDVPHDISSVYSDFEIACIVSHTKQYPIENHTYELVIKHAGSGEIVNITNITSAYLRVKYDLSSFTFDTYIVELRRDGGVMNANWFVYYDALSASSVNVERDVYTPLETAKITYSIDSPDFSNHQYFLVIESVNGEEVFRQPLTKASGEIAVSLEDYEPKLYIASLKRSSSSEVLLAYDTFQVSEGVFVRGKTYDARSEQILPSVFVSYCQEYTGCKNTTSDATDASYQIEDLAVDYEVHVGASKANYTHNNFSFTPLQSRLYEINLFLLPDVSHINVTPPAIVGLTQSYPFHQNVSYATVNIWNETWSANTTTNSMGYFAFENLTPGTYYLNATREKFKSSETYEVNLSSGEIEYVYILMWEIYNLTIRARDAGTHSTIFEFRAILNDGEQEKETTTGKLNFSVEYGIHKVEVGADNYYSAVEYVYVCEDTEKIFYLTPLEGEMEQGVGISYPPHQVEFVCVDLFGNPLTNVYVEATPISTTTGSWDW
ncbi:MAG: carboxypeptidase regulatory-like domain-containing protein, partial [Candidatus Thorarchaeota archaeon]